MIINDILNCLGDIVDIAVVQTGDRDASVLRHVDMVLLDHGSRLRLGQASEGEHADLCRNVLPAALDAHLFESLPE